MDLTERNDKGEKNAVCGNTLYLVATPIGNLSDLSDRAKKILTEVDFIAAEDTRNSLKLLTCMGISNSLISYHEHNRKECGPKIVARLQAGESCALITDAGTPAISDPGEDLVRLCTDSGVNVTSVPGCCAAITALTLSGLPTAKFAFEGFLGGTKTERTAALSALASDPRTLIFYEAPHRLTATLSELLVAFGDRRIALCRELTKRNEEIFRTTLPEAVAYYEKQAPRGEYVLIVEGMRECDRLQQAFWREMDIPTHVSHYIVRGMSKMDAMKACAKDRGMGKSEIYRILEQEKA